jgi:hypothetical protein
MGYVVRMPQLGMSMDEGTVIDWTVDEGDPIDQGDIVAEVESEKTTAEVESREDGGPIEVERVPAPVLAEGDLGRHASRRGPEEVAHLPARGLHDVPVLDRFADAPGMDGRHVAIDQPRAVELAERGLDTADGIPER